ncbi:MAG: GDSL-type esterase/lipase family protein, partial [Pedosphaera sp.]|nr:GDSL-type esterase/lipase family protein [Pedosphaera sp.]
MKKFLITGLLALSTLFTGAAQLELKKGDHIVLLGNTLAERMQHHGWLESYVQAALPKHELVFRNHGFSGDKVNSRPRNKGFINPHEYLKISKADVILAFFGYNESYDNNPSGYEKELLKWIDETQKQNYSGKGAPRIVLFSPISHEDLNDPNLPNGRANNARLVKYAAATAAAAKERGLPYVDLYSHSAALYAGHKEPLTMNGIHPNSFGNKLLAQHIASTLMGLKISKDTSRVESIRTAVLDKNWHWHNRYRATDGNDVWGGRSGLKFVDNQSNRDVLMHELDMIDVMVANRDKKVWAHANGNSSYEISDSNVPPPVGVKSNVGGGSRSSNKQKEGTKNYMTPHETAAQIELAKGLKLNVFASEEMFPELTNPVQMSVDTKGRLWVAAWKTYPKWEPLKKMEDRLLILPDENRDGVADKAITFAKVHNPTGIEFWNGGVIVSSVPDILFLKDTDGDDVADVRIRLFHGLDSADTHHSANNFIYGPGGNLYYQRGVFHVSNVETPWMKNQQHGNSAMYRFNPRTFEYSFHANNSPNPHGISFDYWGYHYATDGTGGRAYQVRPDGRGGFRMQTLLNKTVRPVASSGLISSPHFPDKYQGNFILLNTIGYLGIKQYKLLRSAHGKDSDGDGFSDEYEVAKKSKPDDAQSKPKGTPGDVWGVETENLLQSPKDSNFRPTDYEIGGDGALYVSDWQNIIIGHMQHNVRDPSRDHEYGRVYRVTAAGRPLMKHVMVDGEPIAKLLDLLKERTNVTRRRAQIELSERDSDEVMTALAKWIKQWNPKNPAHAHHLLEALWLHQQHNVQNQELLKQVLDSPVIDARIAAATVKQYWDRDPRKIAPGGNQPIAEVKPVMTPVAELRNRGFKKTDVDLYKLGAKVFVREGHCATCHQLNGKGLPKLYPPLTESEWAGGNEERLIKITLKGLWGELTVKGFTYNSPTSTTPPMTPFHSLLSDKEVAAVLTYVRNTFGNNARPVQPSTVTRVSRTVEARGSFFYVDQILKAHPFTK